MTKPKSTKVNTFVYIRTSKDKDEMFFYLGDQRFTMGSTVAEDFAEKLMRASKRIRSR